MPASRGAVRPRAIEKREEARERVPAHGPAAWAVEFTQNTLIAANDPTYDGQDIIVTGCSRVTAMATGW